MGPLGDPAQGFVLLTHRSPVANFPRISLAAYKEVRVRQAALCPGYRIRVLDGNHLPSSEKRLAALRGFRGAALPGHSLVVYDPDTGLVIDVVPCEDAHAQERTLMSTLLAAAQPGELWIADRNFCTTGILAGWHEHRAMFVVREHGSSPNPTVRSKLRKVGRVETGTIYASTLQTSVDGGHATRLAARCMPRSRCESVVGQVLRDFCTDDRVVADGEGQLALGS